MWSKCAEKFWQCCAETIYQFTSRKGRDKYVKCHRRNFDDIFSGLATIHELDRQMEAWRRAVKSIDGHPVADFFEAVFKS